MGYRYLLVTEPRRAAMPAQAARPRTRLATPRWRRGLSRPEEETMTVAELERPVTEGLRSLEVRWICPGQLEAAVARWFARFPAKMESREDIYLLDPQLPGLSVKIRGGRLEVKLYRGSPGLLELTGRARGRLEFWQKWSFPCDLPSLGRGGPAGWQRVAKRRRISQFPPASETAGAPGPEPGGGQGCQVELTEISTGGQAWWSLGFETASPVSRLRSELETAAEIVFAQALPNHTELGMTGCSSYEQWLRAQNGGFVRVLPAVLEVRYPDHQA
jgi:hypothetical protein